MKNKVAFLIIRASLGLVFFLFGIGKFRNDIWAETIRTMDFFTRLPWNVNVSVILIGLIEILTGIGLIAGLFTRLVATMAVVQLMGILFLLKFEEIRDIGLLGMAIYIAISDEDSFGVNWFLKKRKGGG